MTPEPGHGSRDAALQPLAPGELIRIASGSLQVDIAPNAGGRIARITHEGQEWLVGCDASAASIEWGCYPMVPWAGRLRGGQFTFAGRRYQLPANLGSHAIHGVGFALPWQVDECRADAIELSLQLPCDQRWPFGGLARQTIGLSGDTLLCSLSLQAETHAMPLPAIGWHPCFTKPERLEFEPEAMYPRDAEGIAVRPSTSPAPPPWDDCFINRKPVVLHRGNRRLRLTSDCDHWVVYDKSPHATCVEPQSGPPDAFNLDPGALPLGNSIHAWFRMEWL